VCSCVRVFTFGRVPFSFPKCVKPGGVSLRSSLCATGVVGMLRHLSLSASCGCAGRQGLQATALCLYTFLSLLMLMVCVGQASLLAWLRALLPDASMM
jgi:hypothetical protein